MFGYERGSVQNDLKAKIKRVEVKSGVQFCVSRNVTIGFAIIMKNRKV